MLDVDLERERVSLSLKATQEDPWKEFERTSKAGAIITGQVTKLVPFGAFVRVAHGIEGLVHISEISHEHVDTPESVLSVGDEVQVKVIDVDVSRRRVSLSMRQVSSPAPREPEIKAEPEQRREPTPEMVSTIQIPDDILAAVAEADAARGPEPRRPAARRTPAPPASRGASGGGGRRGRGRGRGRRGSHRGDAGRGGRRGGGRGGRTRRRDRRRSRRRRSARAAADLEVAEEAVEASEEAADDGVSLEAILEDLKRREGRAE